jgi:hypothetical protein
MDDRSFDALTRSLAGGRWTRRRATKAVAGGMLGVLLSGFGPAAAQEAAGACNAIGRRCEDNHDCCSGRCTRRKCRPGPHTCRAGDTSCPAAAGGCNSNPNCRCQVSVEGNTRCAGDRISSTCGSCSSSADCGFFGPQAFCADISGCGCGAGQERVCVNPCPSPS